MVYADFEYYSNCFLGDSIPEEDFGKYAVRASREIDRLTMGRAAKAGENMIPGLSNCTCEIAELLHAEDAAAQRTGNGIIASESNDGISVSFVQGAAADRIAGKVLETAKHWLCWPVNLLYPGV